MKQCKDIPEMPILRFLASVPYPANWFGPAELFEFSVLNAMPLETPAKLALAKMRMMIRKGIVEGCTCGCRGDFKLTDQGRSVIRAGQSDGAAP